MCMVYITIIDIKTEIKTDDNDKKDKQEKDE